MKTIRAVVNTVASFFLGLALMPLVPFLLAYWNWQDRFYDKGLYKDDDGEDDDDESGVSVDDLYSDK